MHFRPNYNISERLACERSKAYGSEPVLKIVERKLAKVDKIKFLGVIIDKKMNWEAHIEHLNAKLNLSIVMIKRIKKFIAKFMETKILFLRKQKYFILHFSYMKIEFKKIYDALFKSRMSYCASSWGGASD